jgi:hypothetical protein
LFGRDTTHSDFNNPETTDNYGFGYDALDGLDTGLPNLLVGLGASPDIDMPLMPSSSTNTVTTYKNAFDISRSQLLNQISKLKDSIFKKKANEDDVSRHNVPIAQMGNYQEVLMRREVLRDVMDDDKVKRPMFGNPFRLDKVTKLFLKLCWY